MEEQKYDLRVPVNKRDLIHVIEAVKSKAETLIYAGVSFGRPPWPTRITAR